MRHSKYNIAGVGNAIVEIIGKCDEAFLDRFSFKCGEAHAVDLETSKAVRAELVEAKRYASGSAVNVLVGASSFGGRTVFIGQSGADEFGEFFRNDLTSSGVEMSAIAPRGTTAHNIVLVTPDGRRTMATCLSDDCNLSGADIDASLISDANSLYIEGYQLAMEGSRQAICKAMTVARTAGRSVALGLAHRSIAEAYRDDILKIVDAKVDILLANEAEITALYGTTSFGRATHLAAKKIRAVALTRGRHGAYVLSDGRSIHVDPTVSRSIVDITGAGDLFAAGFLMALSEGNSPEFATSIGNMASAEIIQQLGAKPERPLAELGRAKGFDLEPA